MKRFFEPSRVFLFSVCLSVIAASASAQDKETSVVSDDLGGVEVTKEESPRKQPRVQMAAPEEVYLEYVRDNVTATVYHELAHALIALMDIPVLGQEEDVADVLSAVLIHERHSLADATRIGRNSALAYEIEANRDLRRGTPLTLWGEHGPAMQRYYNTVCLIYGADPEGRSGFAKEMGLPLSRAEYCHNEYELAATSWMAILENLRTGDDQQIEFRDKSRNEPAKTIAASMSELMAGLNTEFSLPGKLEILLKRCGSTDRGYEAYFSEYFEGEGSIVVCTEYVRDLYQNAPGRL